MEIFGTAVSLTDFSLFLICLCCEKKRTATNNLQTGQKMINGDRVNGSRRKELRGRQEAFPPRLDLGFHFSRLHYNTYMVVLMSELVAKALMYAEKNRCCSSDD